MFNQYKYAFVIALTLSGCANPENTKDVINFGIQIANNFYQNEQPSSPDNSPNQLPDSFGIGTGEQSNKSHAKFSNLPKQMTYVQTWVRIDQVPPKGLNFFALQVNFNNGTWAHGGLQFNNGAKWLANWGGLVNRGGGSKDYTESNAVADINKIQNMKPTTVPYTWQLDKIYSYTIWRGKQIVFPAGQYESMGKLIETTEDRPMWEWHFRAEPLDGGPSFDAMLYNSADSFSSFYVWNECGYGSCDFPQHAIWYLPRYATENQQPIQANGFQYF